MSYLLKTINGIERHITLEEIQAVLQDPSFVSLQGEGVIEWSGITDTSITSQKNPNAQLAKKEFLLDCGVKANFLSTQKRLGFSSPFQVGTRVGFLVTAYQAKKKVFTSSGVTFENGRKCFNFKEFKIISSFKKRNYVKSTTVSLVR